MLTTISRLWSALGRLAAAVEDLAETVEETNGGIRAQLALPGPVNRLTIPAEVEIAHTNGTGTPENGSAKARSGRRQ